MEKSADVRADIRNFLPSARSVIVMGTIYNTDQGSGIRDQGSGSGRDQGRAVRARAGLSQGHRGSAARADRVDEGHGREPFEAAHFVDKHQVQERVFAHHAGIGWIGKNSCVINPELGSWMFLSGIATSLDLADRRAGARSVRLVHALHRRVSDRRDRRRARARCDEMHLLPHDRNGRGDSGSAARADRPARVGLRHLPGRVPVESRRCSDDRSGLAGPAARRPCRRQNCGSDRTMSCTR